VQCLQAGGGGDNVLAGLCEQLAEVQQNLKVLTRLFVCQPARRCMGPAEQAKPLICDIAAAMDLRSSFWITYSTDAALVMLDIQDTEVLHHCRVAKLQERLKQLMSGPLTTWLEGLCMLHACIEDNQTC
jgi:hypothetical protein